MAEMTQEQFARELGGIQPVAPVRERPISPLQTQGLQRYTPTGEEIPLDTDTGASFATRFRMSLIPDDKEGEPVKKAIASEAFSNAKVEAVHGMGASQFVVRDFKDPQTGQIKDVLIDEKSASWKDLADLGETGVQLLGAYLALRGRGTSQSPSFGRIATDAAIGNIGAQAAAGTVEAVERSRVNQPVKPGEILARRSVEAAEGAALDLGLGSAITGGTKLLNMRRGVATTAQAAGALDARGRLAEETGIDVPFSLGEATGSQSLRERELLLRKHILGGGRLEEQKAVQTSAIGEMQAALPGTFGVPADQLPSKDVVGTQAVSALRSLLTGAEQGTARARSSAVAEATQDLSDALTTATGIANRRVLQDEAGNLARDVVNLKHDVFSEIANTLNQHVIAEAGTDAFIPTSLTRKNIEPLLKSITRPDTGELYEFVPPKVRAFLADIKGLPRKTDGPSLANMPEDIGVGPAGSSSPGLITLKELRDLRTGVNDAISESAILGTAETGKLKQISKALTETLEEGIKHAPSPGAAAALERFNKFYRENIEGFQVKGITDILADPTQRKLGPFAIFHQAASDPDQYFRLKDALTKPLMLEGQVADAASAAAGENAWNVFKQGMWDEMTDSSAKAANRSLLDPTKLLNKIEALPTRVRSDLLGSMGDTAIRSLKRLEALDNPKLPAAEALDILRQGGDNAPRMIEQLALREKELDKLYSNQVVKKFAKGEIGAEEIDPSQFVDRFATAGPIADVRDAMNKMEMASPGMTKLVRSKQVQSILESSARSPLDSTVSAKKLAKEIGGQENQERLKAVLGEPGTRRLNDFLEMLTHLQPEKEGTISMGGSMAGGEAKAGMLTIYRALKTLPAQVQYRVAAMLISNPNLYRMATGPVQPLNPAKLIRGVILADDALLDLGAETVREIMGATGGNSIPTSNRQPTQAEFEQQLNAR